MITISQIKSCTNSLPISLAAVIFNIDDIKIFNIKTTNKESKKRNVVITDFSEEVIIMSFWNSEAEYFKGKIGDVLLINNVKIIDNHNMRSLSCTNGTTITINPDIPLKCDLKNWFEKEGRDKIFKKITNLALSK